MVISIATNSLINDLKGNLNLGVILTPVRALQSELMGLNFEVSTSNPIFFESFLVGGYGKNRVTTIKEEFFFEHVHSFFFCR